jgi:glycerol kinase
MDKLAGSVEHTGGVYFVTAFSGLLAPYWDRDAVSYVILGQAIKLIKRQTGTIIGRLEIRGWLINAS